MKDFGFIAANGAAHTALLMNGAVYETHYFKEGFDSYPIETKEDDKLYGKSDFNKWKQTPGEKKKSGVILLPPLSKG